MSLSVGINHVFNISVRVRVRFRAIVFASWGSRVKITLYVVYHSYFCPEVW